MNMIFPSPDIYSLHLQMPFFFFVFGGGMRLHICINKRFKPLTMRDNDIKVTWLTGDNQHLSLQTNSSLQRSTLILDLFYTLSPLICFRESITDMRNRDQGCHPAVGEMEILAAGSGKQQIATHQHSSKETCT